MELVNHTSLSSDVSVSVIEEREQGDLRLCTLIAKAGLRIAEDGTVQLEDLGPEIFMKDEPTALGLLPRDNLVRYDDVFELVLLGAAHAPGGVATKQMRVSLSLGDRRRELLVTGDRVWIGEDDDAQISDPVPFKRMPLTWDRAFGGTTQIWLDEHSSLPISHLHNALGKGWNAQPTIDAHGASTLVAPGYPRSEYDRQLPNVEHPYRPIRGWGDDPAPYCWSPVPLDSGLRHADYIRLATESIEAQCGDPGAMPPETLNLEPIGEQARYGMGIGHTAHPDLRLSCGPSAGEWLQLLGCHASASWSFKWPGLLVEADYTLAERTGTIELCPVLCVLLPEESRLTITYRGAFKFARTDESMERALRLRVTERRGQ